MEKQYVDFAYVYDRLMEDVDYGQWATYIENIFQREGISPNSLLELACGTGNITIPMAKRGYQVMGVDISEDMLMVAKEKALSQGTNILFVQQDMCQLELNSTYDGVLCCCDGINYIVETEALITLFKGVYRYLSPGGIFVFDISTSYKLKQILGNNTFGENLNDLCYLWENDFDEQTQNIDMNLTFFIQEGRHFRKFEELHRQRAYEVEDLKEILQGTGFNRIQCFDGFSWQEPAEESERVFFVCRK